MMLRGVKILFASIAFATALRAQEAAAPRAWSWQGGGGVRYAVPMSTMSGYFGAGHGIAGSLRASRASSALRLAADAEYLHFPEYTVYRPYNGTGPAVAITSAADILLLGFGPALTLRKGHFDLGANIGAGGAYTHSSARTHIGTSPQNDRGNTYTTFTWQVQGGAALGYRLAATPAAPRLELSGRVVHAGETDFLREYNLPVGVISGLYAKPTPYEPTFAVFAVTLTAGL
jgi:hypothetical protein